jgi:hypothetical protein
MPLLNLLMCCYHQLEIALCPTPHGIVTPDIFSILF